MDLQLKGKVVLVTGGAKGIGAAIALRLAAKGVHVVINCTKSLTEAEATAAECRALGVDAIVCQADVARDEDCRRMAQAALEAWGRIDFLVNNAGTTIFAPQADLDAVQAEDFRRIYDVNVIGAFQMGIGLALFAVGARLINAAEVALITLLEVVLGPLWVWIAFSETPDTATLVGGLVVLVAVIVQVSGEVRMPVRYSATEAAPPPP